MLRRRRAPLGLLLASPLLLLLLFHLLSLGNQHASLVDRGTRLDNPNEELPSGGDPVETKAGDDGGGGEEMPLDRKLVAELVSPHVSIYSYHPAQLNNSPIVVLPNELPPRCADECCVSAVADGNPLSGQRLKGTCTRMRALRYRLDSRPLLALVDAVVAKARHTPAKELRIHLIGDSVLFQMYENIICHLRRYRNTRNLTRLLTRLKRFNSVGWKPTVNWIHDTRMNLSSDVSLRLVMIRQYRPAVAHEEYIRYLRTYVMPCDVLIVSWGLHYLPHEQKEFQNDMSTVLDWLLPFAHKKLVIWMGSSAQHFNTSHGEYDDQAKHDTCTPLQENRDRTWDDWRSKFVMSNSSSRYAIARANWDTPNVCRPAGSTPMLFFAPYWNVTTPLSFQHPVGRAILLGKVDCTHWCFAPNNFDLIFDAIGQALVASDLASGSCVNLNEQLTKGQRNALGENLVVYKERNKEYIGDVTVDYFMHKNNWVP